MLGGQGGRAGQARWVGGRVLAATISTVGGGHRAATSHRAEVAIFGAGGVSAAVLGPLVVEGTDGACWVVLFTDRDSVAVTLTVPAARGFVGGVCGLDLSLTGE